MITLWLLCVFECWIDGTLEHWKVAGFGGLASKRGWNKQRVKQFVSIRWDYNYNY